MSRRTPESFANTLGGSGATKPPTDSSMMRVTASRELVAGDMVGDYRIEGLLGEGGMGQVYAAVHPVIGKKAAVKVLRAEMCTQIEIVERFVQEARAVNQIGHPNIVDIFTLGTLPDGRSYLVMEWLSGEALNTRIEREPLSREELCHFGDSIARALDAAHEKNIVHRDLKPENIYLQTVRDERPVIKLLDFGIAKLSGNGEQRMERTRTGMMMGTPMYIAPEQARGQAVDYRADIYSLGVMFFEFVARRLPFEAETAMDLIMKHLMEAPPSLSALDDSVPPLFDELVRQMMAKDPNERPSLKHVREVLMELSCMPEWYEANAEVVPLVSNRTGAMRHMTPRPTPMPKPWPRGASQAPIAEEPIAQPRGKGLWIVVGVVGAVAAGLLAFALTRSKHAVPAPPSVAPAVTPSAPAVVQPAVIQPAAVQPAAVVPTAVVAPTVSPTLAPTTPDDKPSHGSHGSHHSTGTPTPTPTSTSTSTATPETLQVAPVAVPPPVVTHPAPPVIAPPPATTPPPVTHPAPPKGPDSALEGRT